MKYIIANNNLNKVISFFNYDDEKYVTKIVFSFEGKKTLIKKIYLR